MTAQKIPISEIRDLAQKYGWDQMILVAREPSSEGIEQVITYGDGKDHAEASARAGMAIKHHLMQWPAEFFSHEFRVLGIAGDTVNNQAVTVCMDVPVTPAIIRALHEFLTPNTFSPVQVAAGA